MSLDKPVRLFINENTDVAMNLNQEFIRIREGHEEDRKTIVAGENAVWNDNKCRCFLDFSLGVTLLSPTFLR